MYKKVQLFSLILILGIIKVSAQNQPPDPKNFKFGKISSEEFETKITGVDSAAAVKLFDIGTSHFEVSHNNGGLVYIFERRFRYKIINKNGYDLADMEISLYHNNKGAEEKLVSFSCASYNLSNHVIVSSNK